jgi:outer membrane lipoprotein-sorting protein
LRQTGRVSASPGQEAPVMRELKRPSKVRFEFTVQGITGVYVSDGTRGWQVSPFDGDLSPKPLPEEAVIEAMEQADIEGPLVDWKSKGHHVELAGREVVGGREAYKLKVTLKSGDVRYDYIDVKSHYLVRTDSTRLIRGLNVQMQTTFAEHKKVAGVLFPRSVEVVAVGRPKRLRVVVDKIEVNPPLSDARFAVPATSAHE